MFPLSTAAKNAIKTGLSMVIAYGIALHLNWENPKWAGFAVAMISLNNVGQSLNKGAMRMLGTLVALVVAFLLIGLFPQQRWTFMLFLTLYFGFCTYMMGGKKYQYFYNVCAFVCVIVCFGGGVNSTHAFEIGMARAEETALGILVYSIVNVLIWPQRSLNQLNESIAKLAELHGRMFRCYFSSMTGQEVKDSAQDLRNQESLTMGRFSESLLSAKADTYEVWELRGHWDSLEGLITELRASFELWRESYPDIESIELNKILPNINSFYQELDERFSEIAAVLNGKQVERLPQKLSLNLDESQITELSHFERAAILLARQHLNEIEALSFSLLKCIQDIKSTQHRLPTSKPEPDTSQPHDFTLDTDRLVAATRVMITMWIAYFIWIYTRIPGGGSFVVMASSLAISVSNLPFLPIPKLVKPILMGSALGGFVYVFVMPALSSFLGLGLVIFVGFFCICYFLRKPEQILGKLLCMVLFLTITSVHNQQSYSFLAVANTSLMFILIVALLSFAAHVPTTAYPEKAFINLLRRFFRNAEFQLSRLAGDWHDQNWVSKRFKTVFYSEDLLETVQKMQTWNKMIDYKSFPGTTKEEIGALLSSLQDLAFRIRQLSSAEKLSEAGSLVQDLSEDIQLWRSAIQQLFQQWGVDPAIKHEGDLQERLANKLKSMEARIDETLELSKEEGLRLRDYQVLYNLLGCFRSLSKSVIEHEDAAERIDWQQLQESRF